MNIHIELVKKWLDSPESVTRQELKDNRSAAAYYAAAADAYAAAYAAYADAYATDAAYYASYAADAAYYASYAADADADATAYWVKRYEELKEQE